MKKSEKRLVGAVLILLTVSLVGLLSFLPSSELKGSLNLDGDSAEVEKSDEPALKVSGHVVSELDSFNARIENVDSENWAMVLRGDSKEDWLSGIYATTGQDEPVMNESKTFTVYPFDEKGGIYFFNSEMLLEEGDYSLELWVDRELADSYELSVEG